MKFINKKTIELGRIMNELDKFVLRFIKILERYADYVIVSGYVAILFGRTRGTEDIDIFIKEMKKGEFIEFYKELKKRGYWCLNAEDVNEIYDYLKDGLAVRFALQNETAPNFEVKFAKRMLDRGGLNDKLTVITELGKISISSLERQIAFKKYYLKSDKDLEDARHIEKLFKENLDIGAVEHYKKLIKNELA